MTELDALIAAQARDDQQLQEPERLGGLRTVPLSAFDAAKITPEVENARHATADERPGVWRQNRTRPLHPKRTLAERDALYEGLLGNDGILATEATVEQSQAIRLVVVAQKSLRDVADIVGTSFQAVDQRIARGLDRLRAALTTRFALDAQPFSDRPVNAVGGFDDLQCAHEGCPTFLSRYNSRTTCFRHTRGQTRAQFVASALIGASAHGRQDAGSVGGPDSRFRGGSR